MLLEIMIYVLYLNIVLQAYLYVKITNYTNDTGRQRTHIFGGFWVVFLCFLWCMKKNFKRCYRQTKELMCTFIPAWDKNTMVLENSTHGLLGNYDFLPLSLHWTQLLSTNPVLIAFGTLSLDHSKMLNLHSGLPEEPLSPRKQPTPGRARAGGVPLSM